jgi:hypothetical protein
MERERERERQKDSQTDVQVLIGYRSWSMWDGEKCMSNSNTIHIPLFVLL